MGFFYYRREIAVLPTTTGIEKKREKIDALNEKIVILLAKRTQAAKKIGELKKKAGIAVRDYEREHAVITQVRGLAKLHGLNLDHTEKVFTAIMQGARKVQK